MPEQPQPLPFASDFEVGDWLVQPSLDRLSRNGTVLHLRPQLTNLLVLLARNAGRTVSKEEILATVWDGQFVAESGMTRCIAEIRQALGDDARDPKIVQTITKRGYRLVAPVRFIEAVERQVASAGMLGSASAVDLVAAVPALPDAAPPARAVPYPDGVPPADAAPAPPNEGASVGASPRATTGVPAPAAPAPSAAPLSLRFRRKAAWAMASTAGVVVVAGLIWAVSGWTTTPVLSERDTVLLADVVNTTGDAAFDQTLRLALGVHLGQAPFLRILPENRMRAALPLMGKPLDTPVTGPVALEVCRREGAAVLLAGSIARVGTHYAVGLEALACAGGETVARQLREVDSKDDVLAALGEAAGRLRRTLGESRSSLSRYDVPIAEATTPSLEALKALSLGDVARDHSRTADSLIHFRRATELDPQFALAWARRGAAAHNLARAAGDERLGEFGEVNFSFRKAYELRDRVSEPERFYILAHYQRSVAGEPEKAIETYNLWSRSYPRSAIPQTNRASIYVNLLGRFDEGLADALEAVRLSPFSAVANIALVGSYLGSDRRAEARQAIRDAFARGVDNLEWRRVAFEVAFLDGDKAEMERHVQWASGDPTATTVMTEYRALVAASTGRLRAARQLWADATRSAAQVGTRSARAAVLLHQAETEVLLGEPRLGRAAAEAAVALDPREATWQYAAATVALAGDASRASELLAKTTGRAEPDTMTNYVWQPISRALVAEASGRPEEGLQLLGAASRYERGRFFGLVPLGVRAVIARSAGKSEEAVRAFRTVLILRPIASVSPWVPYARLGLARSLREAGDIDASRAAYDAVIEWMKEGDKDAPLLVAARRERAALR